MQRWRGGGWIGGWKERINSRSFKKVELTGHGRRFDVGKGARKTVGN